MSPSSNSLALAEQAFPRAWDSAPSPFLRARRKLADQLQYGIFNRQHLQVLSGPNGAGKTAILRRLAENLAKRRTLLWISSRDIRAGQPLAASLCRALRAGATLPATEALHSALMTRLEALQEQGRPPLVLVDDADPIDDEGRAALEELCRRTHSTGLRVVVAATPKAARQLSADSRYWRHLELAPLSAGGVQRYLEQRLAHIGHSYPGPFDAPTVAAIAKQSQGWPGSIDTLGRDILSGKQLPTVRSSTPHTTAIIAVIGLVLVVIGGWWLQSGRPAQPTSDAPAATEPVLAEPAATGTGLDADAASEPPASVQAAAEPAPISLSRPAAIAVAPPLPDTASDSNSHLADAATPATAPADEPPATAAAQTASAAKPEPIPEPTPETPRIRVHDEAWISEQPGDNWTLQLMVANGEHHMRRLVNQINLPGDYAWYLIRKDNKDWYTLLYGSYANREQAQIAAVALKLHISKPWPRNFASIHTSMGIR